MTAAIRAARVRRLGGWPVLVVLLAPLLGVLVLRASLFNGVLYRDPWFYSGHGWALEHHVEVFNWFYYAIRFPVVLPISWSTAVFGPVAGYLVLRYLILVATGAVVYACARRFTSKSVAACAVVLLAMSPFYLRLVLWDYTTFVGLPASIGAVALWFLGAGPRRRLLTAAGSGALVGVAVFSNPVYGLLIPALFGVEAVAAARGGWGAIREFAARIAAAVAGAVVVFAGGYVGYRFYLGGFSPRELVQPTIDFIRANDERTTPFQVPARVWLQNEPRIYAPVIACLAIVVMMGRSLLANTLAARLAQVAVAYTAVFWLYRKLVTSAVIETWLAYSMTALTICFAAPLVLDAAQRKWPASRVLLLSVVGATAAVTLVVRLLGATANSAYEAVGTHVALLVGLLVATVAAIVALRTTRRLWLGSLAAIAFATSMAVFGLAPARLSGSDETGVFSPRASAELDAYAAAHSLIELVRAEDQPTSRLRMWSTMRGIAGGISWADLPHLGGGIQDVENPVALPQITPAQLAQLMLPNTREILVLAEDPAVATGALPALRAIGLRPRSVRKGTWGDGRVSYQLIRVRGPGG